MEESINNLYKQSFFSQRCRLPPLRNKLLSAEPGNGGKEVIKNNIPVLGLMFVNNKLFRKTENQTVPGDTHP